MIRFSGHSDLNLPFIIQDLPNKTVIGIDPTLITAVDVDPIQSALKERDSQIVSLSKNLVDLVWTDRPPRPANKVFPLDTKYSGECGLFVWLNVMFWRD